MLKPGCYGWIIGANAGREQGAEEWSGCIDYHDLQKQVSNES